MILHFGRNILIILEVLILFNLLIVVHELGHFLAARWRGLFIEQFGIWFGKPLWKKKINGVLYSLGSIPAGGFVKLPQLAPMDIIEGKADLDREKLPPISAIDKIIVAFAGPLFSFGLAVAFAIFVSVVVTALATLSYTTQTLALLGASAFLFIVGLVDDQRDAKLVLNVVLGGDGFGYDLYRRRVPGGREC